MSRPKKVILLYARDDERRSVLSFLLETRGYCVTDSSSESGPVVDAVLIVDDESRRSEDFAHDVDMTGLPMLLIIEFGRRSQRQYPAHAWMVPPDMPPAGLLERIRLMCARKRGPKKKVIVREAVSA